MTLTFTTLPFLSQCNFKQHSRSSYWFRRSSTQRLSSPGKADCYIFLRFFVWENLWMIWQDINIWLRYRTATRGRVSWAVCKDKDFLFYCCCNMGCWFLCQSGWWCSCQFRYIYAILGFSGLVSRVSFPLYPLNFYHFSQSYFRKK